MLRDVMNAINAIRRLQAITTLANKQHYTARSRETNVTPCIMLKLVRGLFCGLLSHTHTHT